MPTTRSHTSKRAPIAKGTEASVRPVRKPKPTDSISIPIEAALRRAWDAQRTIIDATRREDARAFDRKYEAVGEIMDHVPPLYLAGGYASAKDFCTRFLGEEERTVRRNVRVAKYASPDEEVRYGTNKIDAALAYLDAKTGGTVKGRLPVRFESLRIPVVKGSTHERVTFEVATVQQIEDATKALRKAKGTSRARVTPAQKAIEAALAKGPLKTIHVHYADGTLSLTGIPATALKALARALQAIVLPSGHVDG